jgi:hypothetical protein
MNLSEMEAALSEVVRDSGLAAGFTQKLNDTILELAGDFELPALKLVSPVPLTVDGTNWLWPLPEDFHKKLSRVANSSLTPWGHVHICDDIEALNRRDMAHVLIGNNVNVVATVMQGKDWFLGTYPLPLTQNILQLWYYRKPAILIDPGDVPDLMPPEYHDRVIVVKTILKNFRLFTDAIEDGPMKSVTYWEELYRRGLYGEPRGDIGLINYLAKLKGGPKRTGGRDPVGGGRYRYGSF